MNLIQPIKRPINNDVLIDWRNKYFDDRLRYQNFIEDMISSGNSEEKSKAMWLHNFGAIPPEEPEKLYQCNVIATDIKMTVTVLKRNNILEGQRRYDVVKLNRLYIDAYDYKRVLTVNEKGDVVFKTIGKDLSQPGDLTTSRAIEEDAVSTDYSIKSYPINYEDSGWFTNLAISDILDKLKIGLMLNENGIDSDDIPAVFIGNLNFMETSKFEIADKEFEKNLFDIINKEFLKIETELK